MKAGWNFALAFLVGVAALPLAASAGHGHHGGGYGYSGGCGCGAQTQAYYAPPATAQYGQPTPAVGQYGGYQSFSYSPTPAGAGNLAPAAAPVMSNTGYAQAPMAYTPNYYGGYGSSYSNRHARVYNNVVNKSLGHHDYGVGRR